MRCTYNVLAGFLQLDSASLIQSDVMLCCVIQGEPVVCCVLCVLCCVLSPAGGGPGLWHHLNCGACKHPGAGVWYDIWHAATRLTWHDKRGRPPSCKLSLFSITCAAKVLPYSRRGCGSQVNSIMLHQHLMGASSLKSMFVFVAARLAVHSGWMSCSATHCQAVCPSRSTQASLRHQHPQPQPAAEAAAAGAAALALVKTTYAGRLPQRQQVARLQRAMRW